MLYQLSYASLRPGSTRMRRPKPDSSCQPGQTQRLPRTALYVQTAHQLDKSPTCNSLRTNNSPLPLAAWLGILRSALALANAKCGQFILINFREVRHSTAFSRII